MSELSVLPSITVPAPFKDSQPVVLPGSRQSEAGENSFEKYLEKASSGETQKQSQPEQVREKPADRFNSERTELKQGTTSKNDAAGEKTEASAPAEETSKDEGEKDQKEANPIIADQDELLSLLAHLTGIEAAIRAETQPDAAQVVEPAEVLANSDLMATMIREADLVESNSETEVISVIGTEVRQVNDETVTAAESPKLMTEGMVEGEIFDLGQFNQVLTQISGTAKPQEKKSSPDNGEIAKTAGREDSAAQIIEAANSAIGRNQNRFGKETVLSEAPLAQKVKVAPSADQERMLAHYPATTKNGKVNLAVIQTHLAVSDAPKLKTDAPVLNILPAEPLVRNDAPLQELVPTAASPVNKEELFAQLIEHAKVVIGSGGSEMEVKLKPDNLGRLQLKVMVENQVVTAKFVAESQQVKEVIENNLGQLRRDLQENGMQVDEIMVSIGDHQSDNGFERTGYHQEGLNRFKGGTGGAVENSVLETGKQAPLARRETVIDLIA